MMPRLMVSFGPGAAEAPAANRPAPAQVDAAALVVRLRNLRRVVGVRIGFAPGILASLKVMMSCWMLFTQELKLKIILQM